MASLADSGVAHPQFDLVEDHVLYDFESAGSVAAETIAGVREPVRAAKDRATPGRQWHRRGMARPMRLGLVIGQLSFGGAEGQLWMLCRGLNRAAFAPLVYCLSDHTHPYGRELEAAGVPVRIIAGGRAARAGRLQQCLAADRIDLVHAWLFIADAYAWLANRRPRRPLVTSARNCKRQGRVLDTLSRRAFAASEAIVVNSQDVAGYIVDQYGAPRARVRVIHNAIDTQRFHPHPEAAPGGMGSIVTVGRLVEQKNHALFLHAAARLAGTFPDARFVIVGDGPLRGSLETQARRLGIADRVCFAGERSDVETVLGGASLFWLTSRWEGMPNVVLEAMASGVPAIATDAGGTRELIRSGVDGFVVPAGDEDGFVHHSQILLHDSALRGRFAAAARVRAEEFSMPRMVDAFVQLYEGILQ